MKYVGVALYVFWLLLTMFKFESMPKDRSLSYRDVFSVTLCGITI